MFENADTMATVAVKDVKAASKFYEGTLGLTSSGSEEQGVRAYKSGNSTILVYQSQFAGTNKATAARGEADVGSLSVIATNRSRSTCSLVKRRPPLEVVLHRALGHSPSMRCRYRHTHRKKTNDQCFQSHKPSDLRETHPEGTP